MIFVYIWIGGDNKFKSKYRVLDIRPILSEIPEWSFDGSSTNQATTDNSDILLKPCALFIGDNNYVLCECYDTDNNPIKNNHRHYAEIIYNEYKDDDFWFGIEQEYFIFKDDKPIKDNTYCGVGNNNLGRIIAEKHLNRCLKYGIKIAGINSEVVEGQWEFQIGICNPVEIGDHLLMARYLLELVAEEYSVNIVYHPKPIDGVNGSGAHINFSSKNIRNNDESYLYEIIDKLNKSHKVLIDVYGDENYKRLVGKYETSNYDTFIYDNNKPHNRGSSVRIPYHAYKSKNFYIEDRRPGSNIDPYLATSKLILVYKS